MGCAILIPFEIKMLDIRIKKISDFFFQKKSAPANVGYFDYILNLPYKTSQNLYNWYFSIKPDVSDEAYLKSRNNTLISVLLDVKLPKLNDQVSNSKVWIHNIHIPCSYGRPNATIDYCTTTLSYIQNLSKGLPYIFAGDFNIKPQDPTYHIFTNGSKNYNCNPVKSSYFETLGFEPSVTCATQTSDASSPDRVRNFSDCLDYIFYQNDPDSDSKLELLLTSEVKLPNNTYLPNSVHPSDHLPLIATFQLN